MATDFTSEVITAQTGRPVLTTGSKLPAALPRIILYVILALFCIYYLLPLYVMVINSLKPLSEITSGGNMMALPR